MGSFIGHIDEGVVFIYVALWWLYKMSTTYFKSIDEGKTYRTELSYPCQIRGRTVPIENILKVAFPIFGCILEIISNRLHFIDDDGNFQHHSGMQHMTIYALFTIHGVSDLIDYQRMSSLRDLKYITFSLAFAWYGAGFYFHSDPTTGKPPLEIIIHRLPVIPMFLTSLSLIVEIFKRDAIIFQILRCHTVLTFGTWFTYISFVLYTPGIPGGDNIRWDRDNMANVHFMVTAFGIHLIINIVIIMAAFYLAESYRKCVRCIFGPKGDNSKHQYEKVLLMDTDNPDLDGNGF